MAVDLSLAKGSIKNTADELGITPQILTRWRKEHSPLQIANLSGRTGPSQEQQEILRLRKELKQAELERDILKKAVGIFSRNDGTFFSS